MSEDLITYFNQDANSKVDPEEINFGKKKQMFCKGERRELKEI